jgi:hypothetical protein
MALSTSGWIIGTLSLIILLYAISQGVIFYYKSMKSSVKLLSYYALLVIVGGFLYSGFSLDFLMIQLTSRNLDNSYGLMGILTYLPGPPFAILMMYIFTELIIPRYKKHILAVYAVLAAVSAFLVLIDPLGSFTYVYPSEPGGDLIDPNPVYFSLIGMLVLIFLSSMTINGLGFIIKSLHSKGVIKKKLFYLALGCFLLCISILVEQFPVFWLYTLFMRILILISFWFTYLGLREEPAEPNERPPKKEIKVEESLFRLTERPDHITEEEVTISKEKKICIVCKGKVGRSNIYLCPECDTFFCSTCSNTLITLENECWVCNTPIDPLKPVKQYKKEDDIIGMKPLKKGKE